MDRCHAHDQPSARPLRAVLALLAALAGPLACGAASPPPAPPPAPAPAPGASVAPPAPGEWVMYTHEQKLAYMKAAVLGPEKALFVEYDAARYGEFSCKTCHGYSAANGSFKMPNPDLPRVHGGREGFQALADKNPKALRFMQSVVVRETARLLGVKAFDMESHTGFSCYQCHVKAE